MTSFVLVDFLVHKELNGSLHALGFEIVTYGSTATPIYSNPMIIAFQTRNPFSRKIHPRNFIRLKSGICWNGFDYLFHARSR